MKTYTNTHININYNFNLEAANASDLFIVASLTIVGLLWAGFAISKQNKDENTNVIEDSLSTKTDEICFCLENVVDKDTIKVNFAEKQIENVLVLLEKTLDYFLPYYSSVDINYIYNQLNIIIQLMLNGLDYSLNDYNFLLL